MTFILADRVKESSTTTGTGNFTLAGAIAGFQTFDAVLNTNDTTYYSIVAVDSGGVPTGEWETGLATFTATSTLARTLILESSNSGSAVNFSAGTKHVYITLPAKRLGSIGMNCLKLSSDFITSSTTFADITGFTGINLEANSRYLVELVGGYQSVAATTGIAITFLTSGTADVIGQMVISTSSTAVAGTEITGNGTTSGASTGVRAINTTTPVRAWATIKTNASAQTLAARMRSEVSASQVTLLAAHTNMYWTRLE